MITEKDNLECELDELQLRIDNLEAEKERVKNIPKLEEMQAYNQALIRENSDLQETITELNTLLRQVRESAKAEHKQDSERFLLRITDLEAELHSKDREFQTILTKIRSMREEKSNLLEEMHSLEEMGKTLECENVMLKQGLKEREKTIDSLQNEVEQSENMVLETEFLQVKTQLTEMMNRHGESEKKLNGEKNALLEEISRLEEINTEQNLRIKTLEKESKSLKEHNEFLELNVEEWKDKARDLTDKMQKTRENLQKESTDRMIKLKQEKIQLEERINELMEQLGTDRTSVTMLGQPSLMDELQLLESGPRSSRRSRVSLSGRQSSPDKNFEALRLELSEKEFLIKNLTLEVEKLREEVGSLTRRSFTMVNTYNQVKEEKERLDIEMTQLREQLMVLKERNLTQNQSLREENTQLKGEVETWKADLARSQAELIGFKEAWTAESTELKKDLVEAERQAIQAKMMYAEAATDRDIYLKRCRDMTKNPPPKSRLSIFKSRKT